MFSCIWACSEEVNVVEGDADFSAIDETNEFADDLNTAFQFSSEEEEGEAADPRGAFVWKHMERPIAFCRKMCSNLIHPGKDFSCAKFSRFLAVLQWQCHWMHDYWIPIMSSEGYKCAQCQAFFILLCQLKFDIIINWTLEQGSQKYWAVGLRCVWLASISKACHCVSNMWW